MREGVTGIERAFQLADTGKFENLQVLTRRLKEEGYSPWVTDGLALRKQLKARIDAARGTTPRRKGRRRAPNSALQTQRVSQPPDKAS
jgi:hypothetical protein